MVSHQSASHPKELIRIPIKSVAIGNGYYALSRSGKLYAWASSPTEAHGVFPQYLYTSPVLDETGAAYLDKVMTINGGHGHTFAIRGNGPFVLGTAVSIASGCRKRDPSKFAFPGREQTTIFSFYVLQDKERHPKRTR